MQVLSNRFIYESEIGIDYEKPLIHILNKQRFIYETCDKRAFRKNVVVMGDILEDVKMVRDSKHSTVLKVGFLNDLESQGHLLDEFSKTFDIVITGDGSLQHVNYLLKRMFKLDASEDMNETLKCVFE